MSEWIEHDGGGCPVGPDVKVDVRWNIDPMSFFERFGCHGAKAGNVAGWDLVTHSRLVEPVCPVQAHAMSNLAMSDPAQRQHMSDAAWESMAITFDYEGDNIRRDYVEGDYARAGIVLLTVAEHDELLQRSRDRREQDCVVADLCAQVREAEAERDALRAEVERLHRDLRNADAALADMDERLRKGRDDERISGADSGVDRVLGVHRSALLDRRVDALDHRLGTRQPDGEPCEPMSARSWRRMG